MAHPESASSAEAPGAGLSTASHASASGPHPGWWTWLRGYLTPTLVLVTITALGTWGHLTHWKLSHAPHEDEHAAEAHAADEGDTAHAVTNSPAAAAPASHDPIVAAGPTPAEGASNGSASTPAPRPAEVVRFESPLAVTRSGIQVLAAATLPLAQTVTANGVVDYDQTRIAQLSTRVAGTVWSVEKRVGDQVQAGDILALVESADVGEAKSNFLHALAQVELRQKVVERLRGLQSNVVAGKQFQEAEAELRRARVELFNSQQALVNLGLPITVEDVAGLSEGQLVERLRLLGLPAEVVSRLEQSRTTANLIPLVAPFEGVVIGHDVVKGEVVSSDRPQFVMADVRRMWIKFDVRQEDAVGLAVGQSATFTADGLPGAIESQLSWISTEVDEQTRTVQVRAVVENPLLGGAAEGTNGTRLLRANTFGQGRITIRENSQALAVPVQAVQSDGSEHVVFVQEDERTFARRTVTLGVLNDEYAEIVAGLAPGEQVANLGSHVLMSEIVRQRAAGGG